MASPEVSNLSVYHVIIFSSFSLSVTTNSPINTARLSLKSHYQGFCWVSLSLNPTYISLTDRY
jgi:hypothetical protein